MPDVRWGLSSRDGAIRDNGGNSFYATPMQPRISVIIPVFRGENYLAGTIDSVLAQEFEDFELLCLDDCSDDGSSAIAEAYAARDARVRHLRSASNIGFVPKLINAFAPEVRGEWFVYASQDDSFSTDWLSSMWQVAQETGADAVVPDLVFHDDERGEFRALRNSHRAPIGGTEAFLLSLDWTIPGNALWPSRLLRDGGYFDFGMYADEYSARFWFLQCRTVAFARGVFRYYQGNPSSITRKIAPRRLDFPYNEYRIWQLVRDHCPTSPWVKRYARGTFRAVLESLVAIEEHPELELEKHRLDAAMGGLKDAAFQKCLAASFGSPGIGPLVAALAGRPAAIEPLARAIALSRRVRRR